MKVNTFSGRRCAVGGRYWVGMNPTGQWSIGVRVGRRWFGLRACWAQRVSVPVYFQVGPFQVWNLG